MNKRKFLGTILGIIFWSVCVVFFTFAYYEWRSTNTSIVIGINDLSTKCMPGTDVNAENIGPVLNYSDGVISEFSIENDINKEMAIDLRLDITSISDNLLVKSFKYVVVTDNGAVDEEGNPIYDYNNPVAEGNFESFKVGNNIITTALSITESITQHFRFIVYIDGNMKNDINMQNNSLVANLMIGNCEENATSMDELVYQAIYSETDNSLTFIHNKPVSVGDTYNDKAVTAVYTGFETAKYYSASGIPWHSVRTNITTVTFEESVSPKNTAWWFYNFTNLISINNLEKLDTSNVIDMGVMFENCSSLTNLDLSNFNTSNVTKMGGMFKNCSNLTSLDVSNFDTRNVTDMNVMFNNCSSLIELDLSSFDTSKITYMVDLFKGCSSLTKLDLSSFNTSNVTNMGQMFYGCWNLLKLDLSSFNTSNVTGMNSMFNNCSSLTSLDLSNFNTGSVTSMSYMFYKCGSLTSLDLSSFNTSNVTGMNSMFNNCSSLTSLDLSSFNTNNVTSMSGMFSGCNKLVNLNLSSFNTSNVTGMNNMFGGCSSLTSLDLSNFNTSNVMNMNGMFSECGSLTSLDLSNFDTSNVTTMTYMFYSCRSLTSLDLSSFNTSNVTDMNSMLSNCTGLISVDLSNFDMNNTNMSYMFNLCWSLDYINFENATLSNAASFTGAFDYVSKEAEITIKSTDKDWFDTNFPGYTNLVVV